jgi:hypothetical protein
MKTANASGWSAVVLVTLASSFWAFWGINEAFHEGWCKPLLWMRLLQTLAYLLPATVLCALTLLGLRWPRLGAALFVLVGLLIGGLIIWDRANFPMFITATLTTVPVLVGVLFLFGRPQPRRAAYAASVGIPLAIAIGFGIEPAARVPFRLDDGDRGARLVEGNGVALVWAPAGPGWTREGLATWGEAVRRVRYLTEEGTALAATPQDVWRLPTREEVVRSMTRGGHSAEGVWDPVSGRASYGRRPDKESPLWDRFAPLIYLWTAEEESDDRAWIVVYHGGVFAKPKNIGSPSFGFRAVRDPPGGQSGATALQR